MFDALNIINSKFVSMFTSLGKRTWLQYCSTSQGADEIIKDVFANHHAYSPVIKIEPDPEWCNYSSLFPNTTEQKTIRVARQLKAAKTKSTAITIAVVKQLRESGDDLRPRGIDYAMDFDTLEGRDAVADVLAKNGFTIQQTSGARQIANLTPNIALYATRPSPINVIQIRNIEALLIHLSLENGGKYDGWGCISKQPPRPPHQS